MRVKLKALEVDVCFALLRLKKAACFRQEQILLFFDFNGHIGLIFAWGERALLFSSFNFLFWQNNFSLLEGHFWFLLFSDAL